MTATTSPPPIFCPVCDAYLGRRPVCLACRWEGPGNRVFIKNPVAVFAHDQPFLAAPLLAPASDVTGGRTLLLCGYGRRGAGGGLLALDMARGEPAWQVDLGAAVAGGAALAPDGVTLIVGDDAGRLHALRLADGRAAWSAPVALAGASAAPPLLPTRRSEPLLTVATAAGSLVQVDWRTGRVVRQWDLGAEMGTPVRVAAAPVAAGDTVLISALTPRSGGALWRIDAAGHLSVVAATAAGLSTSPLLLPGGRGAVVATSDGELLAVDLHSGAVRWRCQAGTRVRAAPALADGILYAGTAERRLVAVDAASGQVRWALAWAHSINTTPLVVDGLLLIADSAGAVAAFDLAAITAESATSAATATAPVLESAPVWRVDLEADQPGQALGMPSAAVLGGFVVHEGELWCGSANGRIYRLPLHGRQWAWAGEHARRQGRWLDAAAALVWAAAPQLSAQQAAERQAAALLAAHGEAARAAALYAAIGLQTEAAQCYEQAAAQSSLPVHWSTAAGLWRALQQPQRARQCEEQAARLRGLPLLQLACLGLTPLKQGERGLLHLQITNTGGSRARHLRVELAGADFAPCPPQGCPELAPHGPALVCEIFLDARGAGSRVLEVVVHAENEHTNALPVHTWRAIVQVAALHQPPAQVHVGQLFTGPATITEVAGDVGLMRPAR